MDSKPGRPGVAIGLSAAIHGLAVGALLVVPLLRDTLLPDPAHAVRAFLVTPALAPPAPPPPPVVRPASRRVPVAQTVGPSVLIAPTQIPDLDPLQDVDLGVPEGLDGGVEGGVDGGVIGGIVGGLGVGAPVSVPVPVGGEISEPRKLKHVAPTYPLAARAARIQGVVCPVKGDSCHETSRE